MTVLNKKDSVSSINIRIHTDLKAALDEYCEEHIEKIAEAATSAIKSYIGFGKPPVENPVRQNETVEGKALRLDIRVHPRLKVALQEYCDKSSETITDAVSNAIVTYIGFKGKI